MNQNQQNQNPNQQVNPGGTTSTAGDATTSWDQNGNQNTGNQPQVDQNGNQQGGPQNGEQ